MAHKVRGFPAHGETAAAGAGSSKKAARAAAGALTAVEIWLPGTDSFRT